MHGARMGVLSSLHNVDFNIITYLCYQFPEKEQMLEHLAECDIVVYDITGDADQIDEATWAVSGE